MVDFNTYWDTLVALRNPRGEPIFRRGETIEKLWELDADLDKLVRLSGYGSSQNYEKFFADSIVTFMEHGSYTLDDFLRVSELKDHSGNEIFDYSNDFWDFMEIKGKVEDAEAVAQIKDSEGKTIYRIDKSMMGRFDGFDAITDLLKVGGNVQRVQELTDILYDNGVSVFRTPRDINRFIEYGGETDYATALMEIRDHSGNQIFNEFSIGLFREHQGTIDYAVKLTNIRDTEGRTIFSNGEDVEDFHLQEREWHLGQWRYLHRDIKTAQEFVDLKDSEGKTVFRNGRDIIDLLRAKGTVDEAAQYVAIQDSNGRTYFRGDEIALLRKDKVPVDYAKLMSCQGLNAATIMYHYRMGLGEEDIDFRDSGKPKALILYPTSDPVQMVFQAFSEDDTFKFFQTVQDTYNVRIRAISSVEEMYDELDNSPEIDLLILGGHGSKTTLTFGESIPKYDVHIDKQSAVLSTDREDLGDHLRKVSPEGVIFLDSCCNGEGRETERNMANYVAENAPGRKVIAGTDVFNAGKVTVNSAFPLDLSLMACYKCTDCTYVVKR